MFVGLAKRIPIMGLTIAAAELIEKCIISYCKKVFGCANQRPEGPGLYGDGCMQGIRNKSPATFYLLFYSLLLLLSLIICEG